MQEFFKSLPLRNRKDCLKFILNEVILKKLELNWNIDAYDLQKWSTYCSEQKKLRVRRRITTRETLQSSDVTNLLRGSQLGRRLASKSTASTGCYQQPSDSSDDDDSKDEFIFNDSEYDSESDYISSDYNDSDEDMEMEVQDLIRDTDSIGDVSSSTFLQEVLESLRSINKGSINWNIIDVNDLVKDYFQKPDACLKMTHDHLNAISNLITSHTGSKYSTIQTTNQLKSTNSWRTLELLPVN